LSLKGAGCKVNTDVIGGERLLLSACKQGYKTTRPLRTMATWPQVALLPLTTEPAAHADEPAFSYGHVMWRCLQVSLSACLPVDNSHYPDVDSWHIVLHEEIVERFSREQLQRASITAVCLDETQTALEVLR
jgi:hypothetical protein